MSVVNEWTWSDRKAQVLRVLADASFWRWSGRLALALIFLNSTLCFSAIWPTVYVLPKLGIAPEFLCLVMALAVIMYINTFAHIPEVITGLIGAVLIGLAFWSSVRWNKANPDTDGADEALA